MTSQLSGQTAPLVVELEGLRSGLRIVALRALRDADAADEAVQETLVRAIAALAEGRLEDPGKLSAFVAGIARNVCSNMLRNRKDMLSLDGVAPLSPNDHPQLRSGVDPLAAMITAAEIQQLRSAFQTLPSDDQYLLRLCFHEDRTPGEVAAALGEPAERVRKRKSRALERLRRAFFGRGGHDEPASGTDSRTPQLPKAPGGGEGHD